LPTSPSRLHRPAQSQPPRSHFGDDARNRQQQFFDEENRSGTRGTLLAWREAWAKHANRAWNRRTKPALITAATKTGALPGPERNTAGMAPARTNRRHQGGIGCGEPGDSRAGAGAGTPARPAVGTPQRYDGHWQDACPSTSHATSSKARSRNRNALKHPGTGKETNPNRFQTPGRD